MLWTIYFKDRFGKSLTIMLILPAIRLLIHYQRQTIVEYYFLSTSFHQSFPIFRKQLYVNMHEYSEKCSFNIH